MIHRLFSLWYKETYGFATYAAGWIGEIQENTNPCDWYWTEGKNNIADWLTRGRRPAELGQRTKWQRGPHFIREPVEEWPVYQVSSVLDIPEQVRYVMQTTAGKIDSLEKKDRYRKIFIVY